MKFIHIKYIQTLCSYLKQTEMSCFFFYKVGEQENRTGLARERGGVGWGDGGVLVPVGGEEVGKGCGRVNMVQILCTHV
jgi:hypothetical protein